MADAVDVGNRKVRYAVAGIGWISQTAFLPGVEHTGNSEVVAFVSGHEEKAAKVGEKYGVNDLDDYRIVGTLGDLYSSPAFSMSGGMKHTVMVGEDKSEESFKPTDQFGGELKYFSDCIQRDKHPEADGEEGLLDVRIFAAVERALETGEPQKLEPYVRKLRPTADQTQELHAIEEPELVGVHQPSKGR